jgi:hypothetical protein
MYLEHMKGSVQAVRLVGLMRGHVVCRIAVEWNGVASGEVMYVGS